jgi:hypothetical protein
VPVARADRAFARRAARGETGQAAIVAAGAMVFLVIVGLLGVNVGILVASKSSAQRAADAGALAGCMELPNQGAASSMASEYAVDQNAHGSGHLEGGNTAQSTFSSRPDPDPPNDPQLLNGVINSIRVDVSREQTLIGYDSLGVGTKTMGAHAVCTRGEGPKPVLLTLGGQLWVHSNAAVSLGASGLVSASTAASGFTVDGGATVQGRFLDTATGNATISGTVSPPVTKVPDNSLLNDPYAGVPEPQLGGTIDIDPGVLTVPANLAQNDPRGVCAGTYQTFPNETSPAQPHHCHITFNAMLDPGIYWGGLELGDPGGSPVTVTLRPGMYFLAGGGDLGGSEDGGLRIYPNTTVTGSGVIVFNGRDEFASNLAVRGCGQIQIPYQPGAAPPVFDVSPPAAGDYKGLLIFQDRTCTQKMSVSGATIGHTGGLQGAVYASNAKVFFTGTNTMYAIVVAKSVEISNTLTFTIVLGSGTLWHGPLHLVD